MNYDNNLILDFHMPLIGYRVIVLTNEANLLTE
jgi:hypothetical protein